MQDSKQIAESVKKGTTTIGIMCADGVVLGADSRSTMGDFIASEATTKVYKIHDGLAVTIAGVAGYAEYVVKMLKAQNEIYRMNEGKPMSPTATASLLSFILRESVSDFGYAFLIVGGLNNKGDPELFSMDAIGASEKESKYTSIGSGMSSALGYLDAAYTAGMTTQEAAKHALKALQMAAKRSSATGGALRIVAITKKGYKDYSKEEIDKLTK